MQNECCEHSQKVESKLIIEVLATKVSSQSVCVWFSFFMMMNSLMVLLLSAVYSLKLDTAAPLST